MQIKFERIEGNSVPFYMVLTIFAALAAAGRDDAVADLLTELLRDDSGNQRIQAHRGRMQILAGSTPLGLKTLEAAAIAAPDDPWIRTVRAARVGPKNARARSVWTTIRSASR